MSRRKAPPFKKRVEDALEAARAAGWNYLEITDGDRTYKFSVQPEEGKAGPNAFDVIPPKPVPQKGKRT
jgi:hypothetical protein